MSLAAKHQSPFDNFREKKSLTNQCPGNANQV